MDPPVPIPNTEVKLRSADDTASAKVWENRSLPGDYFYKAHIAWAFSFFDKTIIDLICNCSSVLNFREWLMVTIFICAT